MLVSRSGATPPSQAAPPGSSAASAPTGTSSVCAGSSRRWRVVDRRSARLAALVDALSSAHLDGLVITNLANVRYLTGFSGTSAILVIARPNVVLITDFRYQTQAV